MITCTSTDVRTNKAVPESVLLDELLDILCTTMGLSAKEVREPEFAVVRTHPRQAFDRRNFVSDGIIPPFSFDPTALAGVSALAAADDRSDEEQVLLSAPLEPVGGSVTTIEPSELRSFFEHPVKAFFRNRLNVTVPNVSDVSEVQLPTSLGPLDRSKVGRDLLTMGLGLASPEDVVVDPERGGAAAEVQAVVDWYRARGLLPPPAVSNPTLAEISQEVAAMLSIADRYGVRRPAPTTHPIDLLLSNGVRLLGSVTGCIDGARPGPVRIEFHRDRPRHQVLLALDLLVLTATDPETSWRGVAIARPKSENDEPVSRVKGVVGATGAERQANALAALDVMISQYQEGQCYPLPLFEKTSYEFHVGGKPAGKWETPPGANGSPGEVEDGFHVLAFGSPSYNELVQLNAGGHTLGDEAERLWGTLESSLTDLNEDDHEAPQP